jgi:acyl-CoA thioesterase-1
MNPTEPSLLRRSVLLGAVALGLAACGKAAKTPVAATDDAPKPAAVTTEPVVTMLGDSITAGYGLPAADALPAQLEAALAASGHPARVRAAGVSGDTSADGLARLDFSVQDDTTLCIVALGGNDMLQGVEPATTRANLNQILRRLKTREIPVLLAGMRAPPQYGRYAEEYDDLFPELAKGEGVDLYPFLLDGVALDARYNQGDGIHPNAAGVKLIAARLAPIVAAQLAKLAVSPGA